MRSPSRAATQGFTLLEMMAVVMMMGLLLAFALPNLGVGDTAKVRSEARKVAAHLEFARQRAVMTGKEHRLAIGLDEGWYQLEWFVGDADGPVLDSDAAAEPKPLLSASSPIHMSPSKEDQASYRPVPGGPGRLEYLDEAVDFAGAQTSEGWYEGIEFHIVFDRDGTTPAVDLVLRHDDDPGFVLQISPVIDLVRILDEEA